MDGAPRDPEPVEATQAIALRLAGAAGLLTLGLGIYARSLDMLPSDVPLREANGRFYWLTCLAVVIAFGFVVRYVSETRASDQLTASAAVLPAIVLFTALQFVAWDTRLGVVLVAPMLAGAGVFTAVVVRHYLLAGDAGVFAGARLVHVVLTVGVAFLALALLRGWMAEPFLTLAAVLIVSSLLLYQAQDGLRTFPIRRIAYGVVGGFIIAETAFALSYWPASVWRAGALLATIFAVVLLVSESIMTRRVATEVVIRYLGAGVAVCGVLLFLAR